MTVWPSCEATKSFTLDAGAFSRLLPPMKWSATLCFSAYDALPLSLGTVRLPWATLVMSGMVECVWKRAVRKMRGYPRLGVRLRRHASAKHTDRARGKLEKKRIVVVASSNLCRSRPGAMVEGRGGRKVEVSWRRVSRRTVYYRGEERTGVWCPIQQTAGMCIC